jgi:TPP-dependent pyruvate/acetoin dehydrogenase alpha subunit
VARVLKEAWLDRTELKAVDERVHAVVDEAAATAEAEPLPEPASALTDVLAQPGRLDPLWFRRP